MQQMANRTVLLTGAAGGIGRALAQALAGQGAVLALVDRDDAGLQALAADLPTDTSCHVVDLSNTGALERLIQDVVDAHGEIGLLICNAGVTVHGRFVDLSPEEIDLVMEVDLHSVMHLVSRALPHLRRADDSHIVLVSSMAGLQAFPFQAVYSAAKGGLVGFGDALRMELAAEGIGVTTLLPGTIATGFLDRAGDHDPQTLARLSDAMKRWGTSPERVASATIRGIARNRGRVLVGWDAHTLRALKWLLPPVLPCLLRWATRRRLLGTP